MNDPTAAAATGWPDVALWVLNHDGGTWGLIAALLVLFFWNFDANVRALNEIPETWHRRRMDRAKIKHQQKLDHDRLSAEIRFAEKRLHIEDRRAPNDAQGE